MRRSSAWLTPCSSASPHSTDPETLVNIYESEGGRGFNPMSYPNIEDLRKGTTHVFRGIAASTFAVAQIDRGGTVGTVMGEAVTGGAFALLGIEPRLGRAIQPDDDVARGGHPVVMLSHGYWQRAFGGDPQVVGRTLRDGTAQLHDHRRRPGRLSRWPSGGHAGLLRPDGHAGRADGRRHARPARLPQLLRQGAARTRRHPGAGRARRVPRGGVSHRRAARGVGSRRAVCARADLRRAGRPWSGSAPARGSLAAAGRRGAGAAAGVHESRELSAGARPRSGAGGRRAARPRRDARRARAPVARRERAARARRRGGGPRPGARAPQRSAVGRLAVALRHEARPSPRPRLESAVRLESAGAHGWRRRVGRGPSRTRPGRSGNARRSRLGAQDRQQRKRCARASQMAQRAGRRPDRHVARVARGGRAVPEELAADAGRGSGLRPGSDIDTVRHDAGHAVNT